MSKPAGLHDAAQAVRRLRNVERRLDKLTEAIATGGGQVLMVLARKTAEVEEERKVLKAEAN